MLNSYRNNPLLFIIFVSFSKIVKTTKIPSQNGEANYYISSYMEDESDYSQQYSRFNRETASNLAANPDNDISIPSNNSAITKKYTTQQGSKAVLSCNVNSEITNTTVILWKKNGVALTKNFDVLTNDKRFYATFSTDEPNIWTLHIRYTQPKDKGVYECEIIGNQSVITSIELELIEAHAEIIGENPKILSQGNPLRLICELKHSIEEPQYIFWYHWDRVINYDLWDGATVRQGRQGSELIFPRAEPEHAGNYSCVPSNARQASVEIKYYMDGTSESMEPGNINGGGVTCRIRDHISNMLLLVMVLQNVNVTTI